MENTKIRNKNFTKILLFFLILSWVHQWLSLGSFASLSIFSFSPKCIIANCLDNFSLIAANRNQVILLLFYTYRILYHIWGYFCFLLVNILSTIVYCFAAFSY